MIAELLGLFAADWALATHRSKGRYKVVTAFDDGLFLGSASVLVIVVAALLALPLWSENRSEPDTDNEEVWP
jgi:hypothetical protein